MKSIEIRKCAEPETKLQNFLMLATQEEVEITFHPDIKFSGAIAEIILCGLKQWKKSDTKFEIKTSSKAVLDRLLMIGAPVNFINEAEK